MAGPIYKDGQVYQQYFVLRGKLKYLYSVNNDSYISVLNGKLTIWTGILSLEALYK